jgi:competence protein ComEC
MTALAAASLILLLFNPLTLFTAGFQLSFLIVLTIISLVPIFNRGLRRLPAKAGSFLTVPLAAQLGAAPLVAYYFHFFSLPALLANIIIVPLVGGIVCLGFIASLAGLVAEPLAWLINDPNRCLIPGLLRITGWFSRLPGVELRIGAFPVLWIYIWYLGLYGLVSLYFFPTRRRWIAAGLIFLLLTGWGFPYLPHPAPPPLRAIFFNTDSGDQILLREDRGTTILITSDDDRFGDIPAVLGSYLLRHSIRKIDYLILSQTNPDHLNVLNQLLKFVTIDTVFDHPLGPTSLSYPRFREVLEENRINYRRLTADDLIVLGRIRLSVLWPRNRRNTPFQPDYSLVAKLQVGEISFLLPSRIGVGGQEELVDRRLDLRATVLKIPKGGSRTRTSPCFLRAVDPVYALLIQGRKYFGRYPADCAEFLKQAGVEVHTTGEEGSLIVETDGRSCRVFSTLEDNIYE